MAVSQDTAWDGHVLRRVAAMNDARVVMGRLHDMAGANAIFHRDRARLDRKALIKFSKSLPRLFRKERMDLHSRARPGIWENRALFRVRARIALAAARGINPRSAETLRATLPDMLQTCLDCHKQFRAPP
ncbi:MAG: cytochrome c [Heliomarina sp.]|uniref:cytochrome c n=1 Tax=Heliomarina sp. TaxID=2917556 RepID=UPI00405964EB